MRILALDLGRRRIGLAINDELGITAEPARIISSAQTVAKTGRFMKKSTNIQTRTSDFRPRTSANAVELPNKN